jgi:hypothetical protein
MNEPTDDFAAMFEASVQARRIEKGQSLLRQNRLMPAGAQRCGERRLDEGSHARVVRSLPIDAAAGGASRELAVVLARPRLEQILDLILGDEVQSAVASEAASKRRRDGHEIEVR